VETSEQAAIAADKKAGSRHFTTDKGDILL